MLIDSLQIKHARKKIVSLSEQLQRQTASFGALADITRLKILFTFKFYPRLCPTDLAVILGLSLSAVSHQLRLLELSGFVSKKKQGKMICYSLLPKARKFLKFLNF